MMARHLIKEARRVLKILVDSPEGASEALLVHGHGFSRHMLAGLIRSGLATAEREVVETGEKTIEVSRIRISASGREAIKA